MAYGRGLSKADMIVLSVLAVMAGGFVPLVFSQAVDRQQELQNRARCAANLRGIAQSLCVYAADNNDAFPVYSPPKSPTAYECTFKPDEGTNKAESTLQGLYKDGAYAANPSAGLWILVTTGAVSPRQFLCPSDPFANKVALASTKADPLTGDAPTKKGADPGNYYRNFQDAKNFSYSSTFPWTTDKSGQVAVSNVWRNTVDASLPILSDMAPYLGSKGEPATRPAGSDPKAALDAVWAVKTANAQNHQFDGQNVGFADAHAEFSRTPAIGQNNDSIWGIRKGEGQGEIPIEAGTLPHAPDGTIGASDVVMVPTRDAKGDLK